MPLVKQLIKAGANVKAKDDKGNTPAEYAVIADDWDTILAELVRAGADPNTHIGKASLLWTALAKEKPALALEVIKAGANVNEKFQNLTPLSFARQAGYTDVVTALQKAGAK